MIKRVVTSLAVCAVYISSCIPTASLAAADGTPFGGTAPVISTKEETSIYAALKNENAPGSGGSIGDTQGCGCGVDVNVEHTDIRAGAVDEWWTYTVNIPAGGTYELSVLGTSGWGATNDADAGGRFSLFIDDDTVVDGTGSDAVILPATGDGGTGKKAWYEFTDDDKTSLGEVELTAGEHVIKIRIDAMGVGYGPIFKELYFNPVSVIESNGTAWGGSAPVISATESTTIYAARKNIGANGSGGSIHDTMGGGNTVEDNPQYMDVRATQVGEWWTYTVDVSKEGKYELSVLGTSGYGATNDTDAGGRFSLFIDDDTVVDGTGSDAVILPATGDGGTGKKAWYEFTDNDKTSLGEVELTAGEHVIKVRIDAKGVGYGPIFSRFIFVPVIEETDGTAWGGIPVVIKGRSKSTLYAARKNENAVGSGGSIGDTTGGGFNVTDNPEKMDIRGKSDGEWWTYTVNVEQDGTYAIDVLATSGECLSGSDNGSRFTLAIDGVAVTDGTSDDAVILPVWNNDKAWYKFNDNDLTSLGEVELTAGEHIIKVTVNTSGDKTYGMIFSRFYFTPVGVELSTGEPYGGTAVNVADGAKTIIYAARKNTGEGMGGTIKDSTGNNYNAENHPEHMDIRGTSSGEWWAYTINVEKSGLFRFEILGSSGYGASSADTDGGGRFTVKIDSDVITDGTGEDAVVLPPLGDGTENGSNKWWHDFNDADKISLGLIYLEEGKHDIKISVDKPGKTYGVLFKRMWLTSVPQLESIVTDDSLTIGREEEKILAYTLSPLKAEAVNVEWKSSDNSICTVENGKVKGIAPGKATVTLSVFDGHNTVTKDVSVNVVVYAETVTLSRSSVSLTSGSSATVTAEILPLDTTDKTVIWQSSNVAVASVSGGVITANATGNAVVKAYCGNVYAAVNVTVTSKPGGGSSGGGGGGGGFRYVPTATDEKTKTETTANVYTVTNGKAEKIDAKTMEKIFSEKDSVVYNISTNSVTAEIGSEFFTKQPASKNMIYSMKGGSIEINADALNKAGAENIGDVVAKLEIGESSVTAEITVNGNAVFDFNGAVKVKLPADILKDYKVMSGETEIPVEYEENTLVFAPSGSGTYTVANEKAAFTDADSTAWATEAIYSAVEKNFLLPEERGRFGANTAITRGELVSAVVRALGFSASDGVGFTDVDSSNKYYSEITTAKNSGIVQGVDGKTFLPESQISRQDMSVVIYNALKAKNKGFIQGKELFPDDAEISGYAKEAVYALTGLGFIKGRDTGFAPLANMTRAEAAVLVMRLYASN